MENTVSAFITKENLIANGRVVCAAVSGGADSMALLYCLFRLKDKLNFSLKALHFEHGIRGQASKDDAAFVSEQCAKLGVELFSGAGDVPGFAKDRGMGAESAAKYLRESFFEEILSNGNADLIATGHHAGDNLESVLMHMLRGCGVNGLIGVHPAKEKVIRPLLCVGRPQILTYIHKNNITFREDETNSINDNARNCLRNIIIPEIRSKINPGVDAAASKLSLAARADEDFITGVASETYKKLVKIHGHTAEIKIRELNALHIALASRVLRLTIENLCGIQDFERTHTNAVLSLAQSAKTGKFIKIIKRLSARVSYGRLILEKENTGKTRQETYSVEISNLIGRRVLPDGAVLTGEFTDRIMYGAHGGLTECFDAKKLTAPLALRMRAPGDIIKPLNAPGHKKLKDYFIDKKTPREERDIIPLLANGNNILWAIGHTISHDCRVNKDTSKIIKLSYTRKEDAANETLCRE